MSIVSETLTGAASKTASKPSVLCSIVRQWLPGASSWSCGRAGLAGVLGVDHDRQRVVVDDDAVGRVAGLRRRLGDDERDRLADHAHAAVGEDRALGLDGVAERVRGARDAGLEAERGVREAP